MGYDYGDSFPFDFEPNGIPFGSENRKEICHHDHIPFNVKGNGNIVFSVCRNSRLHAKGRKPFHSQSGGVFANNSIVIPCCLNTSIFNTSIHTDNSVYIELCTELSIFNILSSDLILIVLNQIKFELQSPFFDFFFR